MSSRQEELAANLQAVESEISSYSPTLIVVTKTYPISDVEILSTLGVSNFGENRSDEGATKSQVVAASWHYQGKIQSKKIREILSWADFIHSLDDLRHAEKINKTLEESGSRVKAFLQLSLDGDVNRGGLVDIDLFKCATELQKLPAIDLVGMMCVPPVEMKPSDAYSQISAIHKRFTEEFPESPCLSAGMSGDYIVALDHGATHIRVGSKILGQRQYD